MRYSATENQPHTDRTLREIELKEPIRYAEGDPIEKWLWNLLCLDASSIPRIPPGFPHPSKCDLYVFLILQ